MSISRCNLCFVMRRQLSTTSRVLGGVKMNRRKKAMRAENPHLPVKAAEKSSQTLALNSFDLYYNQYFGPRWNSMRLALLSRPKHCVVVNNFGDPELTIESLTSLGCVDVTETFHTNNHNRPVISTPTEDSDEGPRISGEKNSSNEVSAEENNALSLKLESAAERYIDPEELVVGDMSTSMYDFVPTSSLKGMEDFVEERDYYKFYQTVRRDSIPMQPCHQLSFPSHLRVFMFPRSVLDRFPKPRSGVSGNLNYYCMDGGSVLPVLALDLQPGQDVLDMCAGPGGKALVALQTLYPRKLVCNDVNKERLGRVGSVLEQYCGLDSGVANVRESVSFTRSCGSELLDYGVYDRVLCDVPCFSDRHSVSSDEQNPFAQKMVKNRLLLPEQQCSLLKAGLMYLKPGGSLVYSTCTLSPVQNEGVVNMALKALWEETNYEFYVNDLTEALKPLDFMCNIFGPDEGIKLGNLVVPSICNNFGPLYFCKITRKR